MHKIPKEVRIVNFHTDPFWSALSAHCQVGVDQSAPNQAPPGVSNFADGSGRIFSMYYEMATEEDKKMVEDWKADADGILIFVCLYL